MSATDPLATVGQLVAEHPAAAALFERLDVDYCCGGASTLEEACARKGLDAGTVRVLLDALCVESPGAAPEHHDVGRATITDLCDHLVLRHHDPLRMQLARIADLLSTVVRVHGGEHCELVDLERLFAGLRAELEEHLVLEEQRLFPACRALDATGDASAFDASLVVLLEDDHQATGDVLCALRELSGGFETRHALCGTHRTLLRELRAFELDLHRHVHEENNVLFPKIRAAVAAA
jgi:regulator of cell morphogenesis and NO signaling